MKKKNTSQNDKEESKQFIWKQKEVHEGLAGCCFSPQGWKANSKQERERAKPDISTEKGLVVYVCWWTVTVYFPPLYYIFEGYFALGGRKSSSQSKYAALLFTRAVQHCTMFADFPTLLFFCLTLQIKE